MVGEELDVGAIDQDAASRLLLQVFLAAEGSEAPVLGDDDLLPSGKLVLRAAEGLESGGLICTVVSISGARLSGAVRYLLESRVRTLMMI